MQCKNCGNKLSSHDPKKLRCPLDKSLNLFHQTQKFELHKQCKYKRDGICIKPGPCLSPVCNNNVQLTL